MSEAAPALKKNTVDVVISKVGFDAVIPVVSVEDEREYLQKCKPFHVIDGKHPFEPILPENTTSSTSGEKRFSKLRKKAMHDMAEGGVAEDPEYFVSDVGVSPLLGKITRPCQPGWSDHMMEDSTPYHIMTSNSLQTNIKYELNDIDYLWCAENNLDTFSLQRGFTYLEWCYVSSLLKAVESGGALTQLKKKVGPHKGQSDPSDAVEGGTRSARFLKPCAVCAQDVRLGKPPSRSTSPQPQAAQLLHGKDAPANNGVAGLPRLDVLLTRHGVSCYQCQTVAHFRCWGFTQVFDEERWLCDVCRHQSETHSRAAIRCFLCNRSSGGPLLPYKAGAATRSANTTTAESWCHVVCALSVNELLIKYVPTVFDHDGRVKMQQRPYVTQHSPSSTLRITKQKYTQHCLYCGNATPPCLRCGHPNCFEMMHPACAAAGKTLEFFPHASLGASLDMEPGGGDEQGTEAPHSNVGLLLWSHCVPYCSQHYGALLNRSSLSSHALHTEAERVALKLDLTGKLRKDDNEEFAKPSSPVCPTVKRGRGRPPVAFVQMRRNDQGMCDLIKSYWVEKRKVRHQESARWVTEINDTKVRPIVCASLRPELIKVNLSKVRLSHFLSLVPEWQALIVLYVEGELPLPDFEYMEKNASRARGVSAGTRRSGNNEELRTQMSKALQQMETFHQVCKTLKSEVAVRDSLVRAELHALEYGLNHPPVMEEGVDF